MQLPAASVDGIGLEPWGGHGVGIRSSSSLVHAVGKEPLLELR
jgi:hypothetical protein